MILRAADIQKRYRIAGEHRFVLDGVNLLLTGGQICSITGMSGCGKTTLLNVIAGIAAPDSGTVHINDRRMVYGLDILTSRRRNREIGFIFQTFRLLNDETVLSNVLLPARIRGRLDRETRQRAEEMMERLGIAAFRKTKAAILSGGQKQRVAIARSLINQPGLVLADEPTANLDRKTAREIFRILLALKKEGRAVLIITHDDYMHRHSDLVYTMEQGKLKASL